MRTVQGIASFCGAYWPGEEFTKPGYEAVKRCLVLDKKVHFYIVERTPQQRNAYVIKGDRVDTVPACFEGGDAWVLARFRGPKATTVGLLPKNTLGMSGLRSSHHVGSLDGQTGLRQRGLA
jgi:hypothetical protein